MTSLSTDTPPFRSWVTQDVAANRGCPDSQVVVMMFRIAQWLESHGKPRCLALIYIRLYQAFSYTILSIELPPQLVVGPGLRIFHPHGIVLNPSVVLGRDVTLRHGVTIGNTGTVDEPGDCPVFGDDVELGAGAIVLGPITVGDHAKIGAGAVVVKSVPASAVAVGNPATIRPAKVRAVTGDDMASPPTPAAPTGGDVAATDTTLAADEAS